MIDSNEFIDTIEKIQERLNKIDELLIISIDDHVSVDDENNIIIEYDKINNHLLHSLYLRSEELTDITPLSGLTNLTKLDLSNCLKLTDITPLSGLTNLTDLSLSFCYELTNITPLSGLTNLTKLDLNLCEKLTDITPLSGLTKLSFSFCKDLRSLLLGNTLF